TVRALARSNCRRARTRAGRARGRDVRRQRVARHRAVPAVGAPRTRPPAAPARLRVPRAERADLRSRRRLQAGCLVLQSRRIVPVRGRGSTPPSPRSSSTRCLSATTRADRTCSSGRSSHWAEYAAPGTPQRRTALVSVVVAIALIGLTLGTGIATHSLGLLSEAAHSGSDLIAALLTFFAVGVAARPADPGHQYGHGKAEHLSALAEVAILVVASLL